MFRDFRGKFQEISSEGTAGAFSPVQIAFGIQGLNRDDFNLYDPHGYRGYAVYTENFNPFSRAAQQSLLGICSRLEQMNCTTLKGDKLRACQGIPLVREGSLTCVMNDFHAWYREVMFPSSGINLFQLGDAYPDATKQLFLAFATGNAPKSDKTYYDQIGLVDGDLKFLVIDFKLDMGFMQPVGRSGPVWDIMLAFKEELQRSVSQELWPVTLASYELVWVIVQYTMEESLFRGLAICFPFAFVVLLMSSANLLIAIVAVVTIVWICFSCLGFIQVLGWSLGIGETMLAIMIIGLSVDYVIHLGHTYADGRKEKKRSRRERFEHSVELMLDTVIAAWLTTALSVLIMLFGTTGLFEKMAILISSAISLSMFYSAFFFLPLLLLIGPQDDFAQIQCKCREQHPTSSDKSDGSSSNSEGSHSDKGSLSDGSEHGITIT